MIRYCRHFALLALWLWIFSLANVRAVDVPEWIWHDNHGAKPATNEVRYFRKVFEVDGTPVKATIACAADDEMEVYLNGSKVGQVKGWDTVPYFNIKTNLKSGENVLAFRGSNIMSEAGVIAVLDITLPKHKTQTVITDSSWISSPNETAGWTNLDFTATNWTKAVSLGKVGIKPWGDIFVAPPATPAESFTVMPGFKAELLRSAQRWEGSWICMTIDQKGRLIISPQQDGASLLRVTLSRQGRVSKVETIDQPVGTAMGLLWAFDSLYVNGKGPDGTGLYRLHYNHLTDQYDSLKLLKKIEGGGGEHGSHAIVLGPDKHLYIVSGNMTKVPTDISSDSPHRNFADDQLLPRAEDGNGQFAGVKPPGGFILRTDENGKKWELFCAGMRNTYDIAFNPDGELFGFDSDMEWDWGTPWYRPIRFCHLVSGGDNGYREGTGKWPNYYPDSLPSTLDVGIGSPTGVKFGTSSNFPKKFQTALFALDWSYGRIFAAHFTPKGATYDGTFETVLKGKPLNLTDLEFGKDGAMYFITGGRGVQSGLYRLSYVGPPPTDAHEAVASPDELKAAAKARSLRHKLEAFHGKQNPNAVKFAWPYLNSDDRFIRYAARIAIESQPVAQWQDRALAETRTNAGITALLALARCGGKETQDPLLHALAKFPLDGLNESQQLDKLRVIELSFIRQGKPDDAMAKFAIDKLDRHYPAKSEWLNRELSELLIYLQAPDVVAKTLALLKAAATQEEQVHYILHLRNLKTGWTLDQREQYFSWFNRDREMESGDSPFHGGKAYYVWSKRKGEKPQPSPDLQKWFADADREYGDGSSFPKFLINFHREAVDCLTEEESIALASVIAEKVPKDAKVAAAPRKFVNDWKMADLAPVLDQASKGRSFARGRENFTAAQCIQCHRFANEGGAVGPELTAISSRYSRRDILESILEPSKVISEQYINTLIIKKNGDDLTGRIVEEDDKKLVVVTNPLSQTREEVLKSDIQSREASKISPMPEGLVNTFTQDEILDLIAYLESGGKETAAAFAKK